MASPTVVDELIVTLNLDAEPYQKAERKVEQETGRTYRKQQERARGTDRTNRDQMRRLKDVAGGVKSFAKQVVAATAAVTGIGVAVTGILGTFLNFETGLRRQAVGTGMSNRQMQAWSATARRMGADAQAGAEAIAALAKEQKTGMLTGNAPTMVALSKMGINVQPNRDIADILADAQQRYRGAAPGQKQQIESNLVAEGVSGDLILMIKSEIDAREAYARSYGQAVEENREALDKLSDSFESMKAQAISVAASLLTAFEPAIKWVSEKLGEFAGRVAKFANDLTEAGMSVANFQKALDDNFPTLGHLFEGFGLLGELVMDTVQAFQNLMNWLGGPAHDAVRGALNRVRNPFGTNGLGDAIAGALGRSYRAVAGSEGENGLLNKGALALSDLWGRASRGPAAAKPFPHNLENDYLPHNLENVPAGAPVSGNAQSIMATLTGQYGLSVAQAAAVVANWQRESNLNPGAINREGGGTGARGLAQWRGDRTKAFQARYGVMPDAATVAQQIEFAMTDPHERRLMQRSFAGGGDAQQLGTSYSRIYEAHGDVAEDARRGRTASELARSYGGSATAGTNVNIQNMTVQSNNAQDFAQGMQRLPDTQPFNTVIR